MNGCMQVLRHRTAHLGQRSACAHQVHSRQCLVLSQHCVPRRPVQIYMELAGLGKGDVSTCQKVHAEQVQYYEAGLAANKRILEWARQHSVRLPFGVSDV
jgi:hypothetical protein